MTDRVTNLEEKEIRGINFKLVRAFTIGTVLVVSSILFTYYNLKQSIESMRIEKQGDDKYIDLRMKSVEINIQFLQKQIDGISANQQRILNK